MARKVILITLGVLLAAFVVAVIAFPMFAHPARGMEGRIVDADNHPVPGVKVTFQDGTSEITTQQGRFRFHPRSNHAIEIPGFALVQRVRHTGGNPDPSYDYSRAMDYVFSIKGLTGKQDPRVDLFEVTFWSVAGSPYVKFGSAGWVARNLPDAVPFHGMTVMSLTDRFSYYAITRRTSGSKVFIEVEVTEKAKKK